ncbi:hypothetical protein G5C51_22715 [Streptomyces sp. A7024]|uniref:Uncharacterized protein n=1 Tax=Streptomyces coryli TaxID=1128680 RepID=A0A6G4U3P2_9ACTN|nr:hypothetical protein [Streptomyces coryli]NGN66703.1 hypothetical protein [Streptomyces coryli]
MTRRAPALREIRTELPLLAGLLVLIALLAGGTAAAPPLLDRAEGRVLAARIGEAQESDAAVRFSRTFRPGLDLPMPERPDVLASDLELIGGNLARQRPQNLVGPLGLPVTHIGLPETGARIGGRLTSLRLLYAQDAPRDPAYVAGRAPRAPKAGEPIEIAVSTHTRDALRLRPGARIRTNAPDQHLGGVYRRHSYSGPLVVSGVFRTPEARGPAALGSVHPLLERPLRAGGALQAEALIHVGALPAAFDRGTMQFTADWRVPLRLTAAQAARFTGDDGRAELIRGIAAYRQAGEQHIWDDAALLNASAPGQTLTPDVDDEATPVIRALGAEWEQAALLGSFALASLAAVGLATVVVIARLAVRRRAVPDQLRRARGASATGLALERALLTLPFAAAGLGAGLLAAGLVVPDVPVRAGWAIVVAALAWLAVPALTAATTSDRRLRREEPDAGVRRPARLRLTAEAAVLLAAVAGIVALRVRGTTSGPDPQLAAVPVLAGLAVVVVLIRLYPLPVRALARLAGRGRGAVGLIALARAGKEAPAKALALLVLVTTLGTAVFTGLVSETVTEGRRTGLEWRTGGADAVLTGLQQSGAELHRAPGVEHAVPVTGYSTELISMRTGLSRRSADLVAVDPGRLAAARPDSPAARALRALDAAGEGRGKGVEIPAVGSAGTAGDSYTTGFKGTSVRIRVVAELGADAARDPLLGPLLRGRSDPPGTTSPLLLTDTGAVAAAKRAGMVEPGDRMLLLYGERIDPARLRALVMATGVVGLKVDDALHFRAEETAAGPGDVLRPAQRVSAVCGAATAVLALLAVLLELALTAPERGRTLARLRLLGFSGRSAAALGAVQLLPMALAAVAGGLAVGLALPAVLGPALDLRRLAGTPAEPALHTDYGLLAALGCGLLALIALAVVAETAAARRRGLGATLRVGEES